MKRVILIIVTVLILVVLIYAGYTQYWTGFADFTSPTGEFQRGKTLWDWLELLVVPAVIAIGGLLYKSSEDKVKHEVEERRATNEQKIASDRLLESSLQTYLDRMTKLLLDKKLRVSEPEAEVRDIAQVWTFTVVRRLDSERKGILLQFLHKAGLLAKDMPVLNLDGARLDSAGLVSANLTNISLDGAWFFGANLSDANLTNANLREAELQSANLSDANLTNADLSKSNLYDADLRDANLEECNLRGAWLAFADLRNAKVAIEQLAETASLQGARMPDGTDYDGCLALDGDLENARALGVDVTDSEAMTYYYKQRARERA